MDWKKPAKSLYQVQYRAPSHRPSKPDGVITKEVLRKKKQPLPRSDSHCLRRHQNHQGLIPYICHNDFACSFPTGVAKFNASTNNFLLELGKWINADLSSTEKAPRAWNFWNEKKNGHLRFFHKQVEGISQIIFQQKWKYFIEGFLRKIAKSKMAAIFTTPCIENLDWKDK